MKNIKTITIRDKTYQIQASVDDQGNIISETYQPIGNYIEEAPQDNNIYGRQNNSWKQLLNIIPVTQEEYDQLSEHDQNTLYVIYGT